MLIILYPVRYFMSSLSWFSDDISMENKPESVVVYKHLLLALH